MKALILLFALVFGVKAQTNVMTAQDPTHYVLNHTNACNGQVYHSSWVFTNMAGSASFKAVTNGCPLSFTCSRTNGIACNWFCYETFRSGCGGSTVTFTNTVDEKTFLLQCTCTNFIPQFPFTVGTNVGFLP